MQLLWNKSPEKLENRSPMALCVQLLGMPSLRITCREEADCTQDSGVTDLKEGIRWCGGPGTAGGW